MFHHALDEQGYLKDGFLRGSRTNLECYDDGRLVHYGSIKLRLRCYSDKSFQDHYLYIGRDQDNKVDNLWIPSMYEVRSHSRIM